MGVCRKIGVLKVTTIRTMPGSNDRGHCLTNRSKMRIPRHLGCYLVDA